MTRKTLAVLSVVLLAIIAGLGPGRPGREVAAQGSGQGINVPKFQADPAWPRLPNTWVISAN